MRIFESKDKEYKCWKIEQDKQEKLEFVRQAMQQYQDNEKIDQLN